MKMCFTKIKYIGVLLGLSIAVTSLGQEYDDMYFTKKDRKKVDYELKANSEDSEQTYSSYENDTYEEEYLDKQVNPEYIAKYRAQSMGEYDDNPTYGMADDSPEEYFPEEETPRPSYSNVNNYSNSNYSPTKVNTSMSMGFSPLFGWSTTYMVSFGSRGYSPYSYYYPYGSPFFLYDRYGRPVYYGYDPYYTYSPYGYGGRYYPVNTVNYYCPSSYGSGYGGYTSTSISTAYVEVQRTKVKAPRQKGRTTVVTRQSQSSDGTRSGRYLNAAVSSRTSSSTSRKDYSATQNEYFRKSRLATSGTKQAYSRSSKAPQVKSAKRMSSFETSASRYSGSTINSTNNNRIIEGRSPVGTSSRRYNSFSSPTRSKSTFKSGNSSSSRSFSSPSRNTTGKSNSFSSGSRSNSSTGRSVSPGRSSNGSRSSSGSTRSRKN